MRRQNKNSRCFLITAGPTVEDIDPVRFISNRATGKLGVCMAREAIRRGHYVLFVHGPMSEDVLKGLPTKSYRLCATPVRTTAAMYEMVMTYAHQMQVIVMNAAVADFTPAKFSSTKVKKSSAGLTLKLKPTVDILKQLGRKKGRSTDFALIGFALETGIGKTESQRRQTRLAEANRKLRSKNLDAIVLDSPKAMAADSADFTIIARDGSSQDFRAASKSDFAKVLIRFAEKIAPPGPLAK